MGFEEHRPATPVRERASVSLNTANLIQALGVRVQGCRGWGARGYGYPFWMVAPVVHASAGSSAVCVTVQSLGCRV